MEKLAIKIQRGIRAFQMPEIPESVGPLPNDLVELVQVKDSDHFVDRFIFIDAQGYRAP